MNAEKRRGRPSPTVKVAVSAMPVFAVPVEPLTHSGPVAHTLSNTNTYLLREWMPMDDYPWALGDIVLNEP